MRVALLATLLLAVLATGCGDDSQSPEEVTSAAVSGLSKGDEKKVCAQLTEAAKLKLLKVLADDPPIVEPITASSCEDAIVKVHAQLTKPIRAVLEDGEVDKAKITGDKAVVHVTGAGTDVELEKVSDEWKITGGLFKR
jgi:TusA-related sulfurtransferase